MDTFYLVLAALHVRRTVMSVEVGRGVWHVMLATITPPLKHNAFHVL